MSTVYLPDHPREMLVSGADKYGWVQWCIIPGSFGNELYERVEDEFGVTFPPSFIDWHRSHFFLECDCSLVRLPASSPSRPLERLIKELDWDVAAELIQQKLYPFGSDGNDVGPFVFDARVAVDGDEFPIRAYDHEFMGGLEGLSDIIFSSFPKLLECMTHYLNEIKTRSHPDAVRDFFKIDPEGAGKTGFKYWSMIAGI